jgi:hypothetical protein
LLLRYLERILTGIKRFFNAAPASSVIELRLAGKLSGSIFRQRAAVEAYRVEKDHEDKKSDEAL